MKTYFQSISDIENWVVSFKLSNQACPKCHKRNTLHSHGFVRKFGLFDSNALVGKRVYCCNRRNKEGCGKTFQLYTAEFTRFLHFSLTMIQAVLFQTPIESQQRIKGSLKEKTPTKRTASRWRIRFKQNLWRFKEYIFQSFETKQSFEETLQHYAQFDPYQSTLHLLNNHFKTPFQDYQLRKQISFLNK